MAKQDDGYDQAREMAAAALEQIPRGAAFGTRLFNAVTQLSVGTAFEAVALRDNGEVIEVFMTQRALTETAYPGEWHCPGSYQRADEGPAEVFARLAKAKEFAGPIGNWRLVGLFINRTEERGTTNSVVFLVDIEPGDSGKWWPIDQLPQNTVCHHRDTIIPMALRYFTGQARESQLVEN